MCKSSGDQGGKSESEKRKGKKEEMMSWQPTKKNDNVSNTANFH